MYGDRAVAEVLHLLAGHPSAGGEPIDNRSEKRQRDQVSKQQRVKRQIEEIERQRMTKDRIMPGPTARSRSLSAVVADDGPSIDRGEPE